MDALEGMQLTLVREGSVEVEVPVTMAGARRGPARADGAVFYNQAMELARDVSVAVLVAAGGPDWRVLDGLAGTGVRGVRYAVEGPSPREVVLNDANPVAAELSRRNLDRNGVTAARVVGSRLEVLLHRERFDMVDIDPFGSPAPFLAGAVRSVRREGLLAVTATDTPALCGSRSKPCLRRYGARPWRGDAMHETGLRILAGAVVREAARVDRAAVPVLSMAEDHYLRVFCHLQDGARRADAALGETGYAWPTRDGGVATGPAPPSGRGPWAGPLWLGPMHDRGLVEGLVVRDGLPSAPRLARMRGLWLAEAELPPLLVDADRISSRLGMSPPKLSLVIDRLRAEGFVAGRAHTNPVGIKTDAPMVTVDQVFRELADGG